jgi:glucose/arabinose dehydrogenase
LLAGALSLADAALAPVRARAGLQSACPGDCAGDGAVTIEDLIKGVSIALGSAELSTCTAMDSSANGTVTVDELIRAVSAALTGCPAPPSPTAPSTAVATETATPTIAATPTVPAPTSSETPTLTPSPTPPAPTSTATPLATIARFCDLPGSVQHTGPGVSVVPGGPVDTPDLSFMQLPIGFCAHFFANVGNVRQLRFAPGGELFVASPTRNSTGGGRGGQAAILVLPDDNQDGAADSQLTFLSGISATQGLLFTDGYFYYQDFTKILRRPYAAGDRTPTGPAEQVADVLFYVSGLHWPKALDVDDNGTIYVANGGDEGEPCDSTLPFHGGILKLDDSPDGVAEVARGFRNPISLRCARGHNMCFAVELTRDFTTPVGGREKLLPIRQGDDWGFPCCATKNTPFPDIQPPPDCSLVAQEIDSFFVGNTPFDLDFETGRWPEPWKHRCFVPQHGAYGTWKGARVVAIDFDVMTGQVLPGSDLTGPSTGAMSDFATGWDDGSHAHGRPANVAFAGDGRLFLGNDNNGDIIWIAPLDLPTP